MTDAPPLVDCAFPGGNIVVDKITGTTVHVSPDLRSTKTWWFYWYFRVQGAAGKTLTFAFSDPGEYAPIIGARGPAVSTDGGKTWKWLGRKAVRGRTFAYTFAAEGDVRFSVGMPYLESNLTQFLAKYADSSWLRVETLCTTAKGRAVERLHVGRLDGLPVHRVAIVARHHACEMMSNYVLEGIIDAVGSRTEHGKWFRENVELLVIPFMDKDGVEDGDQGKLRHPHDHNEDYGVRSLYPEVRALRKLVPAWSGDALRVALDLHGPELSDAELPGEMGQYIYFVGSENASHWRRTAQLSSALESVQKGPLRFKSADNLPIGHGWNEARSSRQRTRFSDWAETLPGIYLATLLEFPYTNVGAVTVTPARAAAFGRDLALALRRLLSSYC